MSAPLRQTLALPGVLAVAALLWGVAGAADQDSKAAREHEMLRRTQEALRESQAEASELTAGKAAAEQKVKAASDQLETARRESRNAAASLRAQLQTATGAQAELTQKLAEAARQLAALTDKQRETAGQLTERESQLKRVQQDLESSKTANTSCEAKNLKLYEYSQALLDRYHKKGVWAALAQKEPVFGIKEVGIENVVEEYRGKLDEQRAASQSTQH